MIVALTSSGVPIKAHQGCLVNFVKQLRGDLFAFAVQLLVICFFNFLFRTFVSFDWPRFLPVLLYLSPCAYKECNNIHLPCNTHRISLIGRSNLSHYCCRAQLISYSLYKMVIINTLFSLRCTYLYSNKWNTHKRMGMLISEQLLRLLKPLSHFRIGSIT